MAELTNVGCAMPALASLDLSNLPNQEDERFEYKSGLTNTQALKDKVAKAASGFWNSGGGIFIAGVDGGGRPDGGIPATAGRQPIRDWLDVAVNQVTPAAHYSVRIFPHDPASGLQIPANHCVAAIEFEASQQAPHMAPDNRYYIRAGAHTVPASHFLVEALWARRLQQKPRVAHTFRLKPGESQIIQLGVVCLTDAAALDVSITLDPPPQLWKDAANPFPLVLPVLDRANPFFLDVTTWHAAEERFGKDVKLRVEYHDLLGNRYDYAATPDVMKAVSPWRIGAEAGEKIAKSLESIEKTLKELQRGVSKRS
jgi:hypothetical protein